MSESHIHISIKLNLLEYSAILRSIHSDRLWCLAIFLRAAIPFWKSFYTCSFEVKIWSNCVEGTDARFTILKSEKYNVNTPLYPFLCTSISYHTPYNNYTQMTNATINHIKKDGGKPVLSVFADLLFIFFRAWFCIYDSSD